MYGDKTKTMKIKTLTPRQYRKMVDDICDSMIEDELEMLTVYTADVTIKNRKFFAVFISESEAKEIEVEAKKQIEKILKDVS